MPLDGLDAFRPQAGNWRVVGSVSMPRDGSSPPAASPGTGALLNLNTETERDALLTRMEHGDIELALEVMLPKGSNSGLYLQGRYEVQLFDSWGVERPKYSDMGGIYRNWESEPENAFRGIAPLGNAAKAPGLWQTLRLRFRAPRFDADGRKLANARLDFVDLNGFRIHENIELPMPTGGALGAEEVPFGPLMIQGDHGSVAIRRIRYQLLEEAPVALEGLRFEAFHGAFAKAEDLAGAAPAFGGPVSQIDARAAQRRDQFAIVFRGSLRVERADEYTFKIDPIGGVVLTIDGRAVIDMQNPKANQTQEGTARLEPGGRAFELLVFKDIDWWEPQLGLSVRGSSTHWKALHADESFPQARAIAAPIHAKVGSEPRLHRGFFDSFDRRLPKAIGVGDPSGVHLVFDLERAKLVAAWRGEFVDATPMWNDRGDGSFRALGAVERTFAGQALAALDDPQAPYLETNDDLRLRGYRIDEATGRPVFLYAYRGTGLALRLDPDPSGVFLICRVELEGAPPKQPIWLKLAEGSVIEPRGQGAYAIDNSRRYIELLEGTEARTVEVGGRQELRAAFDGASLAYAFIW